jgi:hypothetical protein
VTAESTLNLLEKLQEIIQAQASPWKTREEAAAYLKLSVLQFDKLVARGRIKRNYCVSSPRFRTEDLDRLITKEKNPL